MMTPEQFQQAHVAYSRFTQAKAAADQINQRRLDQAKLYGGVPEYVTPSQLIRNEDADHKQTQDKTTDEEKRRMMAEDFK